MRSIAHFLGVDHAGHTYDANCIQLKNKLVEISDFLEVVYNSMGNDTVLVIIGDHGMTEDGNHGGDSDEETGTIIFGLTKSGSFFREFSSLLRGEDDFLSSITFSYQSKLAD